MKDKLNALKLTGLAIALMSAGFAHAREDSDVKSRQTRSPSGEQRIKKAKTKTEDKAKTVTKAAGVAGAATVAGAAVATYPTPVAEPLPTALTPISNEPGLINFDLGGTDLKTSDLEASLPSAAPVQEVKPVNNESNVKPVAPVAVKTPVIEKADANKQVETKTNDFVLPEMPVTLPIEEVNPEALKEKTPVQLKYVRPPSKAQKPHYTQLPEITPHEVPEGEKRIIVPSEANRVFQPPREKQVPQNPLTAKKKRGKIKDQAIDLQKSAEPDLIGTDDVEANIYFNPTSKQFFVKLENLNGEDFRDDDFQRPYKSLAPEEKVVIAWTNSKIENIFVTKLGVDNKGEYFISIPESKGSCEVLVVNYLLSGEKSNSTKSIILDKKGVPVETMPKECNLPKVDFKEDVGYTKGEFVVSTNFNEVYSVVGKPISITSTITQNGEDLKPTDFNTLIFSQDFTNFYYASGTNESDIAGLGYRLSPVISSLGAHYFIPNFTNEKGTREFTITKRYIGK